MPIQVKRGPEADLIAENLLEGEPVYTLDTKRFMVGDGEGGVTRIPTAPEVSAEIAAAIAILRRGQIQSGPLKSVPSGALELTGQTVSRTTYAALWAYVQANYEVLSETDWNNRKGAFSVGNGTTTFRLPDMRGRVPVGYQSGDTDFGTVGKTGGSKTHQQSFTSPLGYINNIPNIMYKDRWTPLQPENTEVLGGILTDTIFFTPTGAGTPGSTEFCNVKMTGASLQPYAIWRFIIWY